MKINNYNNNNNNNQWPNPVNSIKIYTECNNKKISSTRVQHKVGSRDEMR